MRLRLYLNGDATVQGTYLSLFIVLLRGIHDCMLVFPFNFKTTFCLMGQKSDKRHIIQTFMPDIRSLSFHQPRYEMNIASGIAKFAPVNVLQHGSPYVDDDTIIIRTLIHYQEFPKTVLDYVFSLDPSLPSNCRQILINKRIDEENITQ